MKSPMIPLIMLVLFGSCRKECNIYTQFETAPVLLAYFGNYKPGNYWIYENQDGTKQDSMWVSEQDTSTLKYDKSAYGNCVSLNSTNFLLNSRYLASSNKGVIVNISEGIFFDSIEMSSLVEFKDFNTNSYLFYLQSIAEENLILSTINKTNFKTYPDFGTIYPNGFEFYSTIQDNPKRHYLFSSNMGLVQYASIDQKDTFSLTKYSIK